MTSLCFSGLLELEAGLSPSVMEPRIKVPRPKVTKGFITRSARRELELMKTHQVKSSWVLFTLNQTVEEGCEVTDIPLSSPFPLGSEGGKGPCGGKEAFAVPL